MTIHLHHVHMNVAERERSYRFYETHLDARRVRLNGASEALQASPVLLLLDQTETAPNAALPTGIQHIGWGSQDPAAWYERAHAAGVEPDTRGNTLFNTGPSPTVGAPGSGATMFTLLGAQPPACFPIPDAFSYIYVLGPDQERIEIWSGADLRVNHLHFTTADLATTVGWYERFLGIQVSNSGLFAAWFLDDILFFFEPIGNASDYRPTDDHVLAHVGLAVSNLDTWRMRAQEQQLEVVAEPAQAHGFQSFFVRAPDGVLLELVEATTSNELCQ